MEASGGDLSGTKKLLALAVCLMAAPVAADELVGCLNGAYTQAHLAQAPDQGVARLRVLLEPPEGAQTEGRAFIEATFADQGHAGRDGHGGKALRQGVFCKPQQGWFCVAECDAGTAVLEWPKAGVLHLTTSYLMIGDLEECGGPVDLAEVAGQPTTYRLFQQPQADCDDLRPE